MLRKCINNYQMQPSRDVLKKRCSENMQQIYRGAPMRKCDLTATSELCDASPFNQKFFVWAKEESGSYIYIVFKKYPVKAVNFLKCFSRDWIRVRSGITYLLLINYCNSLFKKTTNTLANGDPRISLQEQIYNFWPSHLWNFGEWDKDFLWHRL